MSKFGYNQQTSVSIKVFLLVSFLFLRVTMSRMYLYSAGRVSAAQAHVATHRHMLVPESSPPE